MEINKFLTARLAMFLGLAMIFASCVKHDDFYSAKVGGEASRKTVVQITGADDIIGFARDVKATNDTFILIDVRRYPNTQDELNQPLTVKLTKNAGLISSYNAANGTSFVELPANSYTFLSDPTNLTFQPGEAVKEIKISVDQTKLDLSKQYALGYSITDPGSGAVINTSLKDGLYSIGVKNKYDGIYSMDITTIGWSAYGISDNTPGTWPSNIDLETSGASSVVAFDELRGDYLQAAFTTANASATAFGAAQPQFTFDPITNKLTNVNNTLPDDGRGRAFRLDPSLNSYFDPASKTIYANYIMAQTGRPDQKIQVVFKYKGPR